MRLIDADALKLSLMTARSDELVRYCYPCEKVLKKIDEQPTIEERKTGRAVYQAGYADGYNSAQLERKGKWIQDQKSKRYRCDQCLSFALKTDDMQENLSDFCPVCGSSMTEGGQP